MIETIVIEIIIRHDLKSITRWTVVAVANWDVWSNSSYEVVSQILNGGLPALLIDFLFTILLLNNMHIFNKPTLAAALNNMLRTYCDICHERRSIIKQ